MTAKEKIIKDAVEGGYNEHWENSGSCSKKHHSDILLDPTFWHAVGKTRGWDECLGKESELLKQHWLEKISKEKWHNFIDHLADGLTIEEALLALENNGI